MLRSVALTDLIVLAGLIVLASAPMAVADEDAVVVSNRAAPLPLTSQTQPQADATPQTAPKPQTAPEPQINEKGDLVYRLPGTQTSVEPEQVERRVRGSAGVAIGTGGYKSAYVAGEFPVGKTGTLGVAYSETDHGNNAVYVPYDAYYGMSDALYGYGHRYGDHRHGTLMRGGRERSLSVSLDFSDRLSAGMDSRHTCSRTFHRDQDRVRAWDDPVEVRPFGPSSAHRFDQTC